MKTEKPLKNNDYYQTPPDFYRPHLNWLSLDSYDLDPCAPMELREYSVPALVRYTEEDDGLSKSWGHKGRGEHVFLNPPYSRYQNWIRKAITEKDNVYIWALLNQSNSNIWQDLINQYMVFKVALRSRIKFILDGKIQEHPRYDNYLVHFGPDDRYLRSILLDPKSFPLQGELIKGVMRVG